MAFFLRGFQQIGQRVLIRNSQYRNLSLSYATDIGINKISAVIIGSFYNTFSVLWSCYLAGTVFSLVFMIRELRKYSFKNISVRNFGQILKKYRKFPLFNNLSNFLNNFSIQIPILLISSKFGLEFVAIYGYANRIISLPINLLASSIAKVYYQEAAIQFKEDSKNLKNLYLSIQKKLILIGIAAVIFIQLFAVPVVNIFLGPEWADVIPVLRMMTIFVFFRFLCNPVSSTFTVINKQEIGLIIVILSIIIRFLTLTIFNFDFQGTILIYSFAVSAFYIFYNVIMFIYVRKESP